MFEFDCPSDSVVKSSKIGTPWGDTLQKTKLFNLAQCYFSSNIVLKLKCLVFKAEMKQMEWQTVYVLVTPATSGFRSELDL